VPSLRHTNEVICAYVIAGARIHLYRHIDILQEKGIFCDTFCYIYQAERLDETGENLGDMTSKLKPHETISKFLSGGPNNYAYTIIDTRNAGNQRKQSVKVGALH
jgi:hypothetical protein